MENLLHTTNWIIKKICRWKFNNWRELAKWKKRTSYSSSIKMKSVGITLPVAKGTKMSSDNSSCDKDGLLCE